MGYQARSVQVLTKIEGTAGTAEPMTAAEAARNVSESSIDPGFTPGAYDRDVVTGTLTRLGQLKDPLRLMKPKFSEEAAGGAATTHAKWHDSLRMSGMRTVTVYKQVVATLAAAALAVGDIIADDPALGSATKVHRVMDYTDSGGVKTVYYMPVYTDRNAAFGVGATMNNLTTTANDATTHASTAAAAKGYGFICSEDTPDGSGGITATECGTVQIRKAGLLYTSAGTKGSVTLNLSHGKPLMIDFNGGGLPVGEDDGSGNFQFVRGAPVTGVTLPSAAPKLMAGQTVTLGGVAVGLTSAQVAIANTISDRPTIGLGDSASAPGNGYGIPTITGRQVTVSCDPEAPAVGTLDLVAKVARGAEVVFYAKVGSLTGPSAANGAVVMYVPRLQLTGELPMAERDGLVSFSFTGSAVGDGNDEIFIAHIFA